MIYPVILSGGSGSRLWPLSRAGYPKQFLTLHGNTGTTMLQDTARRVSGDEFAAPLVVCNEEHRFIVAEQLREAGIKPLDIILEPVGRNTAPAVAAAALRLSEQDPDAVMLVMPSDHVILNEPAFLEAVTKAAKTSAEGALATFGITPGTPETGYGYIQRGQAWNGQVSGDVYQVAQFVEKPDLATAQQYLESGDYAWNSGIFLFSARAYLTALETLQPAMLKAVKQAFALSQKDLSFCRLDTEAFAASPSDSIDYAVMERVDNSVVVPVEMGWSDLGAWSALWEIEPQDESGNVTRGDVLLDNTRNSYIYAEHAMVAATGVDDLIIVATDDAVLVANRHNAQDVKKLVEQLKAQGRGEHNLHTTVHRPWGCYRGIDLGERHQVKRITVNPGEQLSLQMHYHRAEHWIVASGTALVTCGEKEFLLRENESTYIPMGETHRLENPGKVPLQLIEVQSGSYLGEDDIVRFEDGYGRSPQG
ncbi:mannose-1-phosphate guanylyltransferase/mannose-6-phosphate isomerase [Halomonas citrativorans]|uniref:mannose-1-phosphate guanylyltransferase n=1 Tax=Halomonas citrativorans TaxID=2742612 RepID=A0ABR9FFK7_9GAMM|nr:mannose-1-phosphate guanylyltransferase/mannose-6-phosphate isomerase [Halomonas citrativorans]MBE0405278.1 mannose-1-phosphate guanylyltransferase/mannose-6-phosphate isomerase [Halomonas citrativorans]